MDKQPTKGNLTPNLTANIAELIGFIILCAYAKEIAPHLTTNIMERYKNIASNKQRPTKPMTRWQHFLAIFKSGKQA